MKKYWKLISANLAAMAAGLYIAIYGLSLPTGNRIDPNQIEGLFWPEQKQLVNFSLTDHQNQRFNLDSLAGQWNLVFFGYTYCPDICPLTMSTLREANSLYQKQAPKNQKDLRITFVSVDGERDHSDHLANYIQFYDESFIAASGNKTEVDSLTSQLGVPYEIEEHEPGSRNYLVSHSGTLFLISPEGKLMATFQPPLNATEISKRLRKIRDLVDQHS